MKKVDSLQAAKLLREGEIIIAALDAMLALLCDARIEESVSKMRKLKNRSAEKGFSVLMDSDTRINLYLGEIPSLAWDILDTSDAPLILVLPPSKASGHKGRKLAPSVYAQDGTVAMRMAADRYEEQLVQMANAPLACTALLTEDGSPAGHPEQGAAAVLDEVGYVLSLQPAKTKYPAPVIPVIKLGMSGEVEIIRG